MIVNGIAPKKIVQDSLRRYFPEPVDQLYLSDFFELWGNSTVHCEILLINHRTKRKHLKYSHYFLVNLLVILAETWIRSEGHYVLKLNVLVSILD